MSQPLAINIRKENNSDIMVSIYDRYGAYTLPAFANALQIAKLFYGIKKGTIEEFNKARTEENLTTESREKYISSVYGDNDHIDFSLIENETLRIIRICEYLGGGIDEGIKSREGEYISKMFEDEIFMDGPSRYGMFNIGVSKDTIESINKDSMSKAELIIADTLEDCRICTDCIYPYSSEKEMLDYFEEEELEENEREVAEIDLDKDLTGYLSIADVSRVVEALDRNPVQIEHEGVKHELFMSYEFCKCNGKIYALEWC